MKRILTYTLVAEMEIDTNWYDQSTLKNIKEHERKHAKEWIFDHIKSEKVSVRQIKDEKKS